MAYMHLYIFFMSVCIFMYAMLKFIHVYIEREKKLWYKREDAQKSIQLKINNMKIFLNCVYFRLLIFLDFKSD